MAAKAEALGQKVAEEDGVARAVALIEARFGGSSSRSYRQITADFFFH
jgi:hypothetical protein